MEHNIVRFDASGHKVLLSLAQNNFLLDFTYNCDISRETQSDTMVTINLLDHKCSGLRGLLFFIPCNFDLDEQLDWQSEARNYGFCLKFYNYPSNLII